MRLTTPKIHVMLRSTPWINMPAAVPNRHNSRLAKMSAAMLILRKWNSSMKKIITAAMANPPMIEGIFSTLCSSSPP